jgi:23S rRNA (guanosine2251-2'-O)-methyltransferase
MTEDAVLEGFVSVRAAFKSGSRDIRAIYIRQNKWDKGVAWLQHRAAAAGITVERVDDDVIDGHASGNTHGGVIALVGPRKFVALEAIGARQPDPFIAMLDGVEDPFNFGQAVRSLYAAGCVGLVLPPRNWFTAAAVVARASAGASEYIPTAIVDDIFDAADHFHARGMQVACACEEGAVTLYEADLTGPLFLVIGGEKRGIKRSFRDKADVRLVIPYASDFDHSLGTAAATAVMAFEIMRQRRV